MPKLHQIVAVVTGLKEQAQTTLTEVHQHRLKPATITGLYRTYKPLKEQGEQLPSEIQKVQTNVPEVIKDVKKHLVEAMDAVLTLDTGNTIAKATLKVGDKELKDLPVTFLLYLKSRVEDLETFVEKLPTLDPSETWTPDPDVGGYTTQPYSTLRSGKERKAHVLYPETDHHPAQVESYTVDVTVGTWTNVKKSGAIRVQDKATMLDRIRTFKDQIDFARTEANIVEIEQKHIGKMILDHLLAI